MTAAATVGRPRLEQGALWLHGEPRLLLAGEYPYYRDEPALWEPKLQALRAVGLEVVSFYVPWRHHELDDGSLCFDGDGNRDLAGFVRRIARCGLLAIAKPGPFVHAELRSGGLPDRVSPSVDGTREGACSAAGEPLCSQRLALPSSYSASFREDASAWLRAVGDVLRPWQHPDGPLIAVQVGNEGLCGEAGLQIDAHDYCDSATAAFRAYAPGCEPPRDWDPHAALEDLVRWGEWCGDALADTLTRFASSLDLELPMLANLPPPAPAARHATKPGGRYDAWLARNRPWRRPGLHYATTSWVGNAVVDDEALVNHVLAATLRRGPNLEENWSLRWVDPLAGHANVPIFHALLGIACGATGIDVYTACSTAHWGAHLDVDRDFLRETGEDPNMLDPPYGDAAPVVADGSPGPSYGPLRVLTHFLRAAGPDIVRAAPRPGITWCSYAPYSALAAWDPGAKATVAGYALAQPSTTLAALLGHCLARAIPFALADLQQPRLPATPLVLSCGPFMARETQRRLAVHVRDGGALLVLGAPPTLDEDLAPCTTFAAALERADAARALAAAPTGRGELFEVFDAWSTGLAGLDRRPCDRSHVELRLTDPGAGRTFVFVLSRSDAAMRRVIAIDGVELELALAPFASAVVEHVGGQLTSCYVKGISEQSGASAPVHVRSGCQEIVSTHACDLSAVLRSGRWDVCTSGADAANGVTTPEAR
ncbi:MAG TPA: beta-galactosidase [Solirubrobacteraceae bacterium]|jgi:beta-galactosidase|nr:beta-galactosidase [Solirubrobacteraceae bacterium]